MATTTNDEMTAAPAALLDFYGTLAQATSWGPRFEDIIERHGLTWPDGVRDSWATLDGSDHVAHSADRDSYMAWERSRLSLLAERCGAQDDAVEAVVEELYRASKTWQIVAYPEVRDVLTELRGRGVRIVICSNWDWDLPDAVADAGIADLIDVVVTSARAGYRKPHPEFYAHAIDIAGVEPAASVFAGDSWGPDVEGPLAAGIPVVAHVYREGDLSPAPELPPGAHRIPDLTGLRALF